MMVVDPHKHLTLAHRAIWGLVLLLLAFASRLGHDMMLIRADPIPSQLLSLSLSSQWSWRQAGRAEVFQNSFDFHSHLYESIHIHRVAYCMQCIIA